MTLSLVKSGAVSGSIPVLNLATKFLAKVGSGLHLSSKSRKAKPTRGTLDQVVESVFAEPQQQPSLSSKGLPNPQYPALAHNGNATRLEEVDSLTPRIHFPMMALPALATSTNAPSTPSKMFEVGCVDSSDSQPDSPTEVLHWTRPSRAWSLPAAAARPALTLRFEETLAAERATCLAAEEAAAAADTNRQGMESLQRQLVDAQNMVASLRVVNKELQTEVDKLQSQIPSMEVAYENLKGSFFRLQSMYGSVKSKLSIATNEVARLRAELRAGSSEVQ